MPRTRIRETNIEDISFLSETELNEFFGKVVVTVTDNDTSVQETFAQYFPGQGLIQGAGSVTVITVSTTVTVSGSAGGASGETLDKTFTANGSISAFDYVYVTDVDDQVSPAKADSVSTIEVIGMVTNAATSGTSVSVRLQGVVENAGSGLSTGFPLFLDDSTSGDFTETPPSASGTFILQVGHAVSTTDVYVNVNSATAIENLGGTGFDLQSAYDNGDGTITTTLAKPVQIGDLTVERNVAAASGTFTTSLTVSGAPVHTGAVGETNTTSNVGTGSGVFKQKTGVDFELRSILGKGSITTVAETNEITISGSQLESWPIWIKFPGSGIDGTGDGTEDIKWIADYPFDVERMTSKADNGDLTYSLTLAGVTVEGLNDQAVSNTESIDFASSALSYTTGTEIVLAISGATTVTGVRFTLQTSRT